MATKAGKSLERPPPRTEIPVEPSDIHRLLAKTDIPEDYNQDECWKWTGATINGYGIIGIDMDTYLVHRVLLASLTDGELPENYETHHKCETRNCINPEHLTMLPPDEHQRMHIKKMREQGLAHIIVSTDDIHAIKDMHENGRDKDKIADTIGCSRDTINRILRNDYVA